LSMLLVAVGGGVGAVSRYLIGASVNLKWQNKKIPVAMLFVNIIGAGGLVCFWVLIMKQLLLTYIPAVIISVSELGFSVL
jgi:fluoride exporter